MVFIWSAFFVVSRGSCVMGPQKFLYLGFFPLGARSETLPLVSWVLDPDRIFCYYLSVCHCRLDWRKKKFLFMILLFNHHIWFLALPIMNLMAVCSPIQDGPFRNSLRIGRWAKRLPLPKICHTYPTMMKRTVIPYLKKIKKTYKSRDTLLKVCWHQHF